MTSIVDLIGDIVLGLDSAPKWDHGHPQSIINRFKEATHVESLKYDQFPAICLFQDIPEKHSISTEERTATLNIIIITSTDPNYSEAERYDNSFDPILIPLYEELMEALECSGEIQILTDDYDYIEHVNWGKSGIYGNVANIFNDFIDAIEISNLKVKTLKFN